MSFNRFISSSYLSTLFISVIMAVSTTGCMPDEMFSSGAGEAGSSSDQGGDGIVLQLPFPAGTESLCTQGAGGSHSHGSDSTRYDIDLDTDNNVDDEIYAPIGGVAYVHMNSATSGFGYHVNIDVGDGRYAVVAHLDDIFIQDGQEVVVGQLIGYEGCTGNCSGDHVHVGLHEGDAAQDATNGTSVEVNYWAADATVYGEPQIIGSSDFICGLTSEGDPVQGSFYESALPVTMWHPDGTLVKTPDNARTYVLDGGDLRWIQDESVFWSLGYDFDEVVLISDEELGCYGDASSFTSETLIDAVYDEQGDLWLVVGAEGDSDRYRQQVRQTAWFSVLQSWGLSYTVGDPPTINESLLDWPVQGGYAGFRSGTLVSEHATSDVYAIDGDDALPIISWDVYLMMGFASRTVMEVEDGAVSLLHDTGSCTADVGCIDMDAVTTCGGGMDLGSGSTGGVDDDDDDEVDEEESIPEEEEPVDEEEEEEEEEEETTSTATDCGGDDACILDVDENGVPETLAMADDLWISTMLSGLPAFVYGNGGCFGGALTTSDLVYTSSGYYQIDFSDFYGDCTVDLTLVSSVGTDGGAPESDMSNWYWWQGASFCYGGSDLCDLQDNGTSWEEWLLSVSWDPTTGLESAGNGYTSNSQL